MPLLPLLPLELGVGVGVLPPVPGVGVTAGVVAAGVGVGTDSGIFGGAALLDGV